MIIAAFFQSTTALHLNFNGVHPNLILVLVLTWSFLFPWPNIAIWVFVAGFILDIFSNIAFGVFTVSLIAISLLAGFWRVNDRVNPILSILLALPYTLAFNLIIVFLLMILTEREVNWVKIFTDFAFPEGILNVIAMLFIYLWVAWLANIEQANELKL